MRAEGDGVGEASVPPELGRYPFIDGFPVHLSVCPQRPPLRLAGIIRGDEHLSSWSTGVPPHQLEPVFHVADVPSSLCEDGNGPGWLSSL